MQFLRDPHIKVLEIPSNLLKLDVSRTRHWMEMFAIVPYTHPCGQS